MVDTKTIKQILKEANGSLQPAHRLVLEDFLRLDAERITAAKIIIEREDLATYSRQYGRNHEADIHGYRIEQMEKKIILSKELETECEGILTSYKTAAPHNV